MSYKLRPCPICGTMMEAWSNRITCSDKCRQKRSRLIAKQRYGSVTVASGEVHRRRCINCGDVMCNPRLDQKFCCKACRQSMYRQRKKLGIDQPTFKQMPIPESVYTLENEL